ncbi:aminopeptidase P family protein [Caenimonas koreensis]|uniref:aminopeptidase P family protein n=1 Tax=Caenimonas koreensis TaxID=367474 RepID=UPI0037835060
MNAPTTPIRSRLDKLRTAMSSAGVQALYVPSSDPHVSEYLPARWRGREWFSGFTGSMGTLVVGARRAALFADSRYWSQAERELAGSGVDLVKTGTGALKPVLDWITAELKAGEMLGFDAQVVSLAAAQQIRSAMVAAGIVVNGDSDLLELAWPGRPGLPTEPIYEHVAPHAAVARADKLAHVRDEMKQAGATHHFISSLDDIAWLLNLRGADVTFNPVFVAHLLVDADAATLFLAQGKCSEALQATLASNGVRIAPYEQAPRALGAIAGGAVLLVDPRRITAGLRDAVPAAVRVIEAVNPSTFAKSRKTDAQAQFVREAMEQDGAAMCEFYARFEAALARGERLSELTVDEWITEARSKRPGFVGRSFNTIAGFNGNGAMPHYHATPESYSWLDGDGLLLIDSGAQYLGGTTDITRVWPIGKITAAHQRDYTLVLKGMIGLSVAVFPRGTPGPMLDTLARLPLWQAGLDYGHGTGHGVGYFMNVHEGPQTISKAVVEPHMAMEPGMITSNEPGLYRADQWGVRIENLVLNVPCDTPEHGAFGEMLKFETLTLCPIDTRCIDASMLREDEIAWLDDYHAMVRARLAPMLAGDALEWLNARTQPLSTSGRESSA